MRQKQWDSYEAALLLDYCLKVEQKEISREEAIAHVSNALRERAKLQGCEIDSVFQNINGIAMQMSSMRNCYLGKKQGLTISKLFREIVDLYKNDRDLFEKILQGESGEMNNTVWQDFLLWLKDTKTGEEKEITNLLSMVNLFALRKKIISKPINTIIDEAEISKLQSAVQKPGTLGFHSKKMASKANRALKIYLQYLNLNKKDVHSDDVQMPSQSEMNSPTNMTVDFSVSANYAHTKPVSCTYKGRNIPCSGWNSVFINVTKAIYFDCKESFPVGRSLSASSRVDIGSSDGMIYPKEIADGIYLECNTSSTAIVNKLRSLFDICGINYADVVIEYRRTGSNRTFARAEESAIKQKAEWEPQYTDVLIKLLSNRYKYGFRLGSPIELIRIRNYAEEEGIALPDSDEELEREISVAGMNIDGKVYAFSEKLLSEVAALSDTVFNSGATVIFLDRLMEMNVDWLEEQHIATTDMLKTVLKKCRPQYYFGQNIITQGEKITEHEATVKEILRISDGQHVIQTDDLKKKLTYIPADKISWSLSMSSEFVWISAGKYFLMNQFVISDEDAKTISEHVARECGLNGYASITDLPFGNILEENYELSETAMQAAVYNTVLKGKYYLHGKILTKEENGVDISVLLKAYCNGKTHCTVSELMARAEELTGAPNKQNAMVALYDTMIRIDEDQFVSEEQIHFHIDTIDALLRNMVGERFAPVKSVTTFALFPSCGASWNHYLLESFCYRFSKEYRLSVINYNDKNAGLIVANDLPLNYIDMLCEAAANADVELTQEAIGQYFFDNGYTAKRKYSSLPEILERAKKMREEG